MFQDYTSLSKEIEAVQFTYANKDQVFNSLTGRYAADHENGAPVLKVENAVGDIAIVRLTDWIAKDINPGTYYLIKNSIFPKSYRKSE